jgi:hypothetical protein
MAISQEKVCYIIHKILDIRKLSAKWVPKYLNANQKCDWVLASQAILDQYRQNPVEFLNHLVAMDETLVHINYPETKE